MSSTYAGRAMSPISDQQDLIKSHVTRGVPVSPRTDPDQHTFRLAAPPTWTTEAKCIGRFAAYDDSVGLSTGEAAKRCAGCPVIEQCLAAALAEEGDLAAGSRYGIRGGLSPKERAALAVAEEACPRGHTGRWSESTNRCLECVAEDSRELYQRKKQADPDFIARRREANRAARQVRGVCCLECGPDGGEMRVRSLERHIARVHQKEEAA